jgi:hypothetical protein
MYKYIFLKLENLEVKEIRILHFLINVDIKDYFVAIKGLYEISVCTIDELVVCCVLVMY